MGRQFGVLLAEEDLPQHRQQVDGGEDHADRRQHRHHHAEAERVGLAGGKAHEHHQLTHEAAHPRQGQRGQRAHRPEGEHLAHLLADAAHLVELQGVGAVVGGAHQEEQAGADQAVADHLQHGATGAQGAEAADADQHEAHVADRAVGDLAFEVALGEGGEGGVDDVHDPQHHQQRRELGVGFGQDLDVEAQQGIAAHLQQDARQQHVHRRRGLPVGIGQPGVQRYDRQLDPEGDQQAGVTEHLEAGAERLCGQGRVFKAGGAAAVKAHGQGRQQDEHRATGGVEDELGGGVLAFLGAPDRQQQVDRQQLQLPGQEEQQHVLHGEHGDLAAIHRQDQEIKEPRLEGDRPGRQHRQGGDEAGQQDQGHRQAVGPHGPGQPQIGQPLHPLHQLQTRHRGVVAVEVAACGQQEGDQGNAQGIPADLFAVPLVGDEGDQQGSRDREQDRGAQPGEDHGPVQGVGWSLEIPARPALHRWGMAHRLRRLKPDSRGSAPCAAADCWEENPALGPRVVGPGGGAPLPSCG